MGHATARPVAQEYRLRVLRVVALGWHLAPSAGGSARKNPRQREATPSAACINSQSMKTTEIGGHHRGYDGGKKLKGRKRHLLVDTLGLLIAVLVTGANLDDGTAAPQLLTRVTAKDFPRLTTIFGDNKYHNHSLEAWLAKERPTWHIEIQSRPSNFVNDGQECPSYEIAVGLDLLFG